MAPLCSAVVPLQSGISAFKQYSHFIVVWFIKLYMGQKLQDGKKVLEMSQLHPHSKSRPVQTIHPTDLALLPIWKSIFGAPAQEFSPSWNARKRVQEMVQENPGNLYFQKMAKNRIKSGKFQKIRPLLL